MFTFIGLRVLSPLPVISVVICIHIASSVLTCVMSSRLSFWFAGMCVVVFIRYTVSIYSSSSWDDPVSLKIQELTSSLCRLLYVYSKVAQPSDTLPLPPPQLGDGLKFVFGPDIIPSGWLGSKHQLTTYLFLCVPNRFPGFPISVCP